MPFLFEGLPKGSSTTQARKETAEETEQGAARDHQSPRGSRGRCSEHGVSSSARRTAVFS